MLRYVLSSLSLTTKTRILTKEIYLLTERKLSRRQISMLLLKLEETREKIQKRKKILPFTFISYSIYRSSRERFYVLTTLYYIQVTQKLSGLVDLHIQKAYLKRFTILAALKVISIRSIALQINSHVSKLQVTRIDLFGSVIYKTLDVSSLTFYEYCGPSFQTYFHEKNHNLVLFMGFLDSLLTDSI